MNQRPLAAASASDDIAPIACNSSKDIGGFLCHQCHPPLFFQKREFEIDSSDLFLALIYVSVNFRRESRTAFAKHSPKGEGLRMPILLEALHDEAQSRNSRRQHSRFHFTGIQCFARRSRIARSQASHQRRFSFEKKKNSTSEKGKKIFFYFEFYLLFFLRFELSLGCKQAMYRQTCNRLSRSLGIKFCFVRVYVDR